MYLDLHILHIQDIQVRSKVIWQVEPLQPWSSNHCRLTVGKGDSINKASWIQKRIRFWSIPRIMPELYPNHTPNFPILNVGRLPSRTCVLWAQIFSSQPLAMGYISCCFWEESDNSGTLQRHPAMAPTCQLQSACAHHFHCNTLKQHPAAAPADQFQSAQATPIAVPCSSSVQQHPTLAPFQHHPCTTTSRLARQHPQAATLFEAHISSSSITLRQHLQRHQHAHSKLYTPLWYSK